MEWDYPVKNNNILSVNQVHSVLLNNTTIQLDAGTPLYLPELEFPQIKLGAPGTTEKDKSLIDPDGKYIPTKVSFVNGFNQLKFTYRMPRDLNAICAYVTGPSESVKLGSGILVFNQKGTIEASSEHNLNVDINNTNFTYGNVVYILAIYARDAISNMWSATAWVIDLGNNGIMTVDDAQLHVVVSADI